MTGPTPRRAHTGPTEESPLTADWPRTQRNAGPLRIPAGFEVPDGLTRRTFNATPTAEVAAAVITRHTSKNVTDAINEALTFYGLYLQQRDDGYQHTITGPDGARVELIFM